MTCSIQTVTDAMLHECAVREILVSNLKLQKLLYYAQGWHLAFTGEPLFEEEIEAWVHGPAIPKVFRRFKHFKWNAIQEPEVHAGSMVISNYFASLLKVYGRYSAKELESLTHSEEPWLDARVGLAVDEPSSNVIHKAAMQSYFSSLIRASA